MLHNVAAADCLPDRMMNNLDDVRSIAHFPHVLHDDDNDSGGCNDVDARTVRDIAARRASNSTLDM